jgi:HSP20 family protein
MMTLIRREPFEFPISRVFSQMLNDAECNCVGPVQSAEGTLPLDISEDERHVIVRASLPGFTKEQIDVQVHDGVLTVKATHDEEREEKSERFYRRERRFGSLSRSIELPGTVEGDRTEAQLKDGVLSLRIPKSERALPRKVEIK